MRGLRRLPILASLVFFITNGVHADWKDDVGFTDLENLLGGSTPTGAGVPVTQVEANAGTNPNFLYLPDTANAEFSGKTITDGSGMSTGPSGHATSVGQVFYGNSSSIAPDVTQITGFDAGDWLDNQLDFAGGGTPLTESGLVQNHSWVGSTASNPIDEDLLQRFDFQIDRDDFLGVVGVNNGVGNPFELLSNSYNAISVGLTNGNHSSALTTVNGPGRVTPTIVAPGLHPVAGSTFTSWATGMVSSAGAMLHETASGTDAARPETMRAILMAGATKDDVNGTWSHTTTQPLDTVFGAGELNVFNSYHILDGGEHEGTDNAQPGSLAPSNGWDYQSGISSPGTTTRYYDFQVPAGQLANELSIILAWNAEVTDTNGGPPFDPSTSLANMDLEFWDSTLTFLDSKLTESVSTIENAEHIYMTGLGEGTYTLALTSDTDRDFGLAWRMDLAPVPEPSGVALMALAGILALARRRI